MRTKVEVIRGPAHAGRRVVVYEKLTRGSASVKIHECHRASGRVFYQLVYHQKGQRHRPIFANKDAARAEAKRVLDLLCDGECEVLILRGTERHVYIRALEALEDTSVPLDVAAREFAHATRQMDGKGSLHTAVQHFLLTGIRRHKEVRVADVVAELLVARQADGSSPRHIDDLKSRLERFARSFQCAISSVMASDIDQFFRDIGLSARSVNNYRTAISNLFGFARMRQYAPKDHDPVSEVAPWKELVKPVPILSPTEMRRLLSVATRDFIPYLSIAGFAGLRQSEIERLTWEQVSPKHIRVPPGTNHRAKSNRVVPVHPNLERWLDVYKKGEGPVVRWANVSNVLVEHFKAAGIGPRHNALRHSFASYRLAQVEDAAKVAHEMGNSPAMVYRHYREVVTPEQAQEWFALVPA